MGSKDTAAVKPATATATATATAAATAATAAPAAPAAPVEAAAPVVKQEATGKGKLYTVVSPIKHDGEDYAAGDEIRLPEATAHRLAGYLKA